MIMNKIVNATEPKDKLKQLAIEFISQSGGWCFEPEEIIPLCGEIGIYGVIRMNRNDNYYILIDATFPKDFKFFNEIEVSATCIARMDGEDVFDCEIKDLGLTKKQLAAFIRWVKIWSLDYK